MKIILHINELEKWPTVVQNAKNTLTSGMHVDLVILANGGAVQVLKDSTMMTTLKELVEASVVIRMCQRSLTTFEFDETDLPSFVRVVPVGMIELALLQTQGYSYIKP